MASSRSIHCQQMIKYLKSGNGKDVEFKFNQEPLTTITAHKSILSARSPEFSRIFASEGWTTGNGVFLIDNSTPLQFNLFLEHLYGGHKVDCLQDAFALHELASRFQVDDIASECRELLQKDMTDSTVVTILEKGTEEAKDKAFAYICKRAYIVLDMISWNELSKENLKAILKNEGFQPLNEIQVLDAVIRWGRAEMERQGMPNTEKYLRSVLEDVVGYIRFPQILHGTFILRILLGEERILSSEERDEMRDYFSLPSNLREMATLRFFNKMPRMVPTALDDSTEFIVNRLTLAPKETTAQDSTGFDSRQTYTPGYAHHIQFKTNAHVFLTSIHGIPVDQNAYNQYYQQYPNGQAIRSMPLSIRYEVTDFDNISRAVVNWDQKQLFGNDGSPLVKLPLGNEVLIIPGKWYTISLTTSKEILFEGVYVNGKSKIQVLANETEVDWEFENAQKEYGSQKIYTGVEQGHIPGLGFKV